MEGETLRHVQPSRVDLGNVSQQLGGRAAVPSDERGQVAKQDSIGNMDQGIGTSHGNLVRGLVIPSLEHGVFRRSWSH